MFIPAPTIIINTLLLNIFISNITSFGAKNFPEPSASNTDPNPPLILNTKNPNAKTTPTIKTTP